MKDFFRKFTEKVEYYLPMSFGSFLIFLVILYMFYLVGRSIWINYNSNKDVDSQTNQVILLKEEIDLMKNQINYYQTRSYKEKQAREKLAYMAPGERVVALPVDKEEEKSADGVIGEVEIKTPNYIYWWSYFFEK